MSSLDAYAIQQALENTIFRAVYVFPEVNSTNTQLLLAARFGEPDGTVYIAENQTAGRGRFRRAWTAPPGKALLVSVLLYPDGAEERWGLLPMLAALAAAHAIEETAALPSSLKWPNDILVRDRKVGGVLAECERVQGGRRMAIVVGFGVNVNQTADELPNRPVFPATSLALEAGREVERAPLLIATLKRFSSFYQQCRTGGTEPLLDLIRRRMTTLGRRVMLHQNGAAFSGSACDISPRGGLLVRLDSGPQREFLATDIEEVEWKL